MKKVQVCPNPAFLLALSTLCNIINSSHCLTIPFTNNEIKNLKAAVLVPGFLTGADEFQPLCEALADRGIPTISIPLPNWHWLPCLGGRSARPILERIDFTVKHLIANDGDVNKIPVFKYSLGELWHDFQKNPGGVFKVGGSDVIDEYPTVEPQGKFLLPDEEILQSKKNSKVALIGHSAGGWISRAYLSNQKYGGKAYKGQDYIHSLVTLGTPHATAPGPAFEGVKWCNEEPNYKINDVKSLAVGGTGFMGGDTWGSLTAGAYQFCCPNGSDGSTYDGDGVTPLFSSLALPDATETIAIPDVTHFCWGDVFGGDFVAPELTKDYKNGRDRKSVV